MQIEVGQIFEGKITGITKFGAFVDLGDGKTGLVHVSEVASTFVNDVHDFIKEGDVTKVKVLSISDDGKISLSIKRAMEQPKAPKERVRENRPRSNNNEAMKQAVWTPRKSDSDSFEEMMARFKQTSEDKFSDLKKKNPEVRRSKRGNPAR